MVESEQSDSDSDLNSDDYASLRRGVPRRAAAKKAGLKARMELNGAVTEVAEEMLESRLRRKKDSKSRRHEITKRNLRQRTKRSMQDEDEDEDENQFEDLEEALREVESGDEWPDNCSACGKSGDLVCCEGCPTAYHPRCVRLKVILVFLAFTANYCPFFFLCIKYDSQKASPKTNKPINIRV